MSQCPKCGGAMEEGFVIDRTSGAGNAVQGEWQEGEPVSNIWFGVKKAGQVRHAIISHRCERCGFLESYAH